MKNFNISLFLGCCVISVGIIVAGFLISNSIPKRYEFPNNLTVTLSPEADTSKEYMSSYQAADYLAIDINDFTALIVSGKLDGTFVEVEGKQVFSREMLSKRFNEIIFSSGKTISPGF